MFRSTRCLFPSLLIAVIAVGCARSSRTVHMQSVSLAPPLPGAIPVATGSGVIELTEPKGPMYYITTYGARPNGLALENQKGINAAIAAASIAGGGIVVIPSGTFETYSIRMKSNVGLRFAAPRFRPSGSGSGYGRKPGWGILRCSGG